MKQFTLLFLISTAIISACGASSTQNGTLAFSRPTAGKTATLYGNDALSVMDALAASGITYNNLMEGFSTMQATALTCTVSSATSGNIVCTVAEVRQNITGSNAAVLMQTMSKLGVTEGGAHMGYVKGSVQSLKCNRYANDPSVSSCSFVF